MFIKFIRWIKGYVSFEITGRFVERFINLCIMQGRMIFDTDASKDNFTASLLVSDYNCIRYLAKRAKVRLKITRRCGLPFIVDKYRSRSGLLAGAAIYIVIALFMQCFMWSVDINGVETLSEPYIRTLLKENGVYPGALKFNLNYHAIERDIMKKIEKIGWMSINTTGTKVEVELQEKADIPLITDADTPCNIKASRDGTILQMNVKQGSTTLTVGSAVMEGQLIVSGVTKNALEQTNFVHADAQIIAATEHTFSGTVRVSGVYNKPVYTTERKSLLFFCCKIPYVLSPAREPYASRVVSENLSLNSVVLPVGRVTEHCTLYQKTEYILSDNQISDLVGVKDYLYRLFELKDCMQISAESSVSLINNQATFYIKYNCTEDIAIKENIIVNE